MRRLFLALVTLLVLAAPQLVSAQTAIGPGQETADLNDYLAKHEDDRGLGADVARAMQRLGRLEEEHMHAEAAAALWKRAKHWFEKHHYERNGSPEAHLAAEATRKLLSTSIAMASDLRVRMTPQPTPEAAVVERTAELDSFLTHFIGKRVAPEAVRQGGLFHELESVRSYGALSETRKAAMTIAELEERAAGYLAQLPIPEGLPPAEQTAQQAAVKAAIAELQGRAFTAIEAAWLAGPDKKVAEALALRKQLTRLRPLKYPQLEEAATDMVAVTADQAEASRLAGLAQATSIVALKVRFLTKAVQLDPQNPRYLELLQAAKGQAGQQP